MRKPRVKGIAPTNHYHVISHLVDGTPFLTAVEMEYLIGLMFAQAYFSGIQVLTYAVLGSHWHALIQVPQPEELDEAAVLQRMRYIYPESHIRDVEQKIDRFRVWKREDVVDELLQDYRRRMYDMADFVKGIKQRFTQWYNRRHGRRGTLWEGRYKSVVVEGSDNPLWTMAAYIDLNPVRASLVDDPKDYRFSGYGAAMGGVEAARQGLTEITHFLGGAETWHETQPIYRRHLYAAGLKKDARQGFNQEKVREILEQGGQLSKGEMLLCRVRYFTDGLALGSQEFINSLFATYRSCFGKNHQACKMQGTDWGNLHTLSKLRQASIVMIC